MDLLLLPYHRQCTSYTCGPAALEMVFGFFKLKLTERELAKEAKTNRSFGTKHSMLIEVARRNGFYCYVHNGSTTWEIKRFLHMDLPVIVNYIEPEDNEGHYAVVVGYIKDYIILDDPWDGERFRMKVGDFEKRWFDNKPPFHETKWIIVLSRSKFNEGRQYAPEQVPKEQRKKHRGMFG